MENADREIAFRETILRLIALKQEGGYWDFKKQWYDSGAKSDLLHDIICMANNLQNRDAYIIIGVDEESDYAIVNTLSDRNRKNTQKLVDFLKDKKFAGGVRPVVHVEQIGLHRGNIDVIIIENGQYTPYYLTESYERVRANYIYTRVMDTNTPIDRSADINHVEYLWRKRFHIDETPLEKFRYYLSDPTAWDATQGDEMGYFFKNAPEYTIINERDTRNGYEYYLFSQVNHSPSWWLITLKYHQTAIEQFLGISLDGGRSFVVAPCRAYDLYGSGISDIGYYIRGDLRSRLLEFFHQKETSEEYSYRDYMNAVVVFNSADECKLFFDYVKRNNEKYHDLYVQRGDAELPYFPEIKGMIMDGYKKCYRDALVLRQMLSDFRTQQLSSIPLEDTNHADA